MFDIITKKVKWGRFEYSLETGMLARQARAAVVASCQGTSVLAALTVNDTPVLGMGYAPLAVHYQEKAWAAGKIPGGFFKREGRPTEKEILTSRLIDRPLRAVLGKGFLHEAQLICSVLSYDQEHDPDILAILASMAAANLAKLPMTEQVAACRIAKIDNELVLNPTISELSNSTANVTIGGTSDKVIMLEGDSQEFAEKDMLDVITFGLQSLSPIMDVLQEFRELDCARKVDFVTELNPKVKKELDDLFASCDAKKNIMKYQGTHNEESCKQQFGKLKQKILETYKASGGNLSDDLVLTTLQNLYNTCARELILKTKKRLDNRDLKTVRDIDCRINMLPTPHGSSLFTRGKTQSLCTVTLGTKDDEQIIDSLQQEYRESFMLHYNFPPFSVGEINMRLGSPNRREIGHGKLAWRAFHRLLPKADVFPYTIRVVSEILESNGSSSMATVCGTSLAMWDAGVPVEKQVAGVAMGAVITEAEAVILSDISGAEDGYGDMDFKIAGTETGITAIQLDVKCHGINLELVDAILSQARDNRLSILKKMKAAIDQPREDVKDHVLRVHTLKVDKEQIAELIGGGGKTIRGICSTSNAKVDIEDDGSVKIYASSKEDIQKALDMIQEITIRPEIGKVYSSQIARILPFGAILNIGKHESWLHISEIANKHIGDIDTVLKIGQLLQVRVLSIDEKGKSRVTARINETRSADQPSSPSGSGDGHRPRRRSTGGYSPSGFSGRRGREGSRDSFRDREGSRDSFRDREGSRDSFRDREGSRNDSFGSENKWHKNDGRERRGYNKSTRGRR